MENKNIILDKLTEEEKRLIYKQVTSDINRKYREEKREQIIERYRKKIPCTICGCVVDYTNMSKHRRSKKCMRIKQEIENNQNTQTENNQIIITNIVSAYSEDVDNDFSEEYMSAN